MKRRAELLDGAIDVIAERGLDGVTLVDVANEVDVTTGALGYYFRSKDELLASALRHLSHRIVGPDADRMTVHIGDLGLYLPLDERSRKFWRVWTAYCGAAPSSSELLETYRQFYEVIEDRVSAHLARRGVADPDEVAGAIVAAVDGIGLCATVAPELWPDDRQVTTLRRLIEPLLSSMPVPDVL